jgi:hypothetical protein
VSGFRGQALRGLPTPVRLWAAAVLCFVPMGFVWSGRVSGGYYLYGDCSYTDDYYCVPDQYVPGSTKLVFVSQAPVRVFLVAAAIAFVVCAARVRTPTTRALARLGCVALVAAAALAAGQGAVRVLACVLVALALVAPLVAARPGVLAKATHPG